MDTRPFPQLQFVALHRWSNEEGGQALSVHSSVQRNSAQSSRALEATRAQAVEHWLLQTAEAVAELLCLGTRTPYRPVVTIQPAVLLQPGESTRIQSMGSAPSESLDVPSMALERSADMAVAPDEGIALPYLTPMDHLHGDHLVAPAPDPLC